MNWKAQKNTQKKKEIFQEWLITSSKMIQFLFGFLQVTRFIKSFNSVVLEIWGEVFVAELKSYLNYNFYYMCSYDSSIYSCFFIHTNHLTCFYRYY